MADTTRMRALRNIANALPVANAGVAAGQAAARDMQLQRAVQKAPATTNITQASQQTGTSQVQGAGQQVVENTQQTLQQLGQVGQLGLAEGRRQAGSEVAGLQSGSRETAMDNVQRLAALDSRAKKELYDDSMRFARDENGRTMFNEHQLADYARMRARSDEEFRNYAQTAKQASDRRLQMMEAAYKKIAQDMDFKYAEAKQKGDQETQRQIAQDKADMDARMQRERARAQNRAATWQAGGTILGAAAGAAVGGPAGAMAGAGVGSAVGGLASSLGG